MYHGAGSPHVQLNSSKGCSARFSAVGPVTNASQETAAEIPQTLPLMEDLPIASRIAVVKDCSALDSLSDGLMEPGLQGALVLDEEELIGGLVRILSRGQRRSAPPV